MRTGRVFSTHITAECGRVTARAHVKREPESDVQFLMKYAETVLMKDDITWFGHFNRMYGENKLRFRLERRWL